MARPKGSKNKVEDANKNNKIEEKKDEEKVEEKTTSKNVVEFKRPVKEVRNPPQKIELNQNQFVDSRGHLIDTNLKIITTGMPGNHGRLPNIITTDDLDDTRYKYEKVK